MQNQRYPVLKNIFAAKCSEQALDLKHFTKLAAQKLKKSSADGFLIVKFDVDRFAELRSRYGSARGEALLEELTNALGVYQRRGYLFTRIEDKFILLVPYTEHFVSELQDGLAEAVKSIGLEKYVGMVSFSFGAYHIKDVKESIADVLDKVRIAHKTAGKNPHKSVVWYDAALAQAIAQENYYNEHLLEGIARNEFKVYLQRQVVLADASLMRAKALARWALPNGRMVYPDSFIPQFQKNGMIVHLDFYIIEQVCGYLRDLSKTQGAEMSVTVNLSPVTLFQPDFQARFLAIIAKYAVSPKSLVLELQHPDHVENTEGAREALSVLAQQGFRVAAETITLGNANLPLMTQLPLHCLKIDRHFIRLANGNEVFKRIMAGIIYMAHSLSLQVICEGIEHQSDVALLKELGGDIAQGYYLMRAVPKEDFWRVAQDQAASVQSKLEQK